MTIEIKTKIYTHHKFQVERLKISQGCLKIFEHSVHSYQSRGMRLVLTD